MISVCCSTYVTDATRFGSLLRLVKSIPPDCEIIIHDDASPFPVPLNRGVIRSETNLGWTAGTAKAVAASTGDIVLLADDDVVLPMMFFETLRQLMSIKNIGALSWRSQGPNAGQSEREIAGLLEPATQLAGYCMAFKRSVYDAVGGLDTRFRQYCGDSELALRMALAGHPCYRVWWPLVPHEERGGTGSQDRDRIRERDLMAFYEKYGAASGEKMERRALAKLIPPAHEHTK